MTGGSDALDGPAQLGFEYGKPRLPEEEPPRRGAFSPGGQVSQDIERSWSSTPCIYRRFHTVAAQKKGAQAA
jgi:hypothetical protein